MELAKYKNDTLVSVTRRFCAIAIDALILIVISFCAIIGSYAIVENLDSYKNSLNTLNAEMIECYELQEEARVYEYIGEGDGRFSNPRQQVDIFEDYCLSHILYSKEKDPQPFETYKVNVENPKNLPVASYEVDNLAYFFVGFIPEYNNYKDKDCDIYEYQGDPRLAYYNEYKKEAVLSIMWVFNEETLELPYLKGGDAVDLYKYLFIDKSHQAGLTMYNYLSVNFQRLWRIECDLLINSQRYLDHFDTYQQSYANCSYIIDLTIFIDYIISFAIVLVLPQIIFKNCKTFGKKIMKISVVDKRGYELQIWQIIIRNIFLFIVMFGALVASCFLAGGTGSGWMYPLFEIAGAGISLFAIMAIVFIIGIISFVISIFTPKKSAIHDFACKTMCIDDRYHATENESYSLKKEIEDKEIKKEKFIDIEAETPKYFDSSYFNNAEREDLNKKD